MNNLLELKEELILIKRKSLKRFKILLMSSTITFIIFLIVYPYLSFKVPVMLISLFQLQHIIKLERFILKLNKKENL